MVITGDVTLILLFCFLFFPILPVFVSTKSTLMVHLFFLGVKMQKTWGDTYYLLCFDNLRNSLQGFTPSVSLQYWFGTHSVHMHSVLTRSRTKNKQNKAPFSCIFASIGVPETNHFVETVWLGLRVPLVVWFVSAPRPGNILLSSFGPFLLLFLFEKFRS